jgi:hypothetical protein
MDETARMPIALMAGVLDPVDPAKLAKAPIQGFLKKPIELRELGDRVKALLVTPVPAAPSPFSTVPATPAQELMKKAERSLPEFRPEPEPTVSLLPVEAEVPASPASAPSATEDDLLILTVEDLWPEEPALEVPVLPEVHLELEELDLDSLQDLASEPLPSVPPPPAASLSVPEPEPEPEPEFVLPMEEEHLVTLSGLEDLGPLPEDFDLPPDFPSHPAHEAPPQTAPEVAALAEPEAEDHGTTTAAMVGLAGVAAAGLVLSETKHGSTQPVPPLPEPAEPEPTAVVESLPAADGQLPAAAGQPAPPTTPAAVSPELAREVVQAMLADPVLVDALVKAVVARMGDQVLREIAWEVLPDLAERLHR